MNRRCLVAAIALYLILQLSNSATTTKAIEQPVAPIEYAVYDVVIAGLNLDRERFQLLVIEDHTWRPDPLNQDLRSILAELAGQSPSILKEVIPDFKAKNEGSHQLRDLFGTAMTHKLISAKDLRSIFGPAQGPDAWKVFYESYPRSYGLLVFSRVGFDVEMKRALVYVQRRCGDLCGYGDLVLLSNDNGEWKPKTKLRLWVS
jgi:hypothetical protein